jgi:hypothetical protein
MKTTKINRREVLAFITLADAPMPDEIAFHFGLHEMIALDLDDHPLWADFEDLTPKQRRRGARKSERDLLAGAVPTPHPNRGKGLSGHPGRRREQLAERAR